MAVTSIPYDSKLKIVYSLGVNNEGKELKKTKSYSDIKISANDQDLYDVAQVLNGLQENTVIKIVRADEKELTVE